MSASALVAANLGMVSPIFVETPGGKLKVDFQREDLNSFTNIYLQGPAELVFEGLFQL